MPYTNKQLDEMRECCKSDKFYAERDHRKPPGMVFLVERLDAAERALSTAMQLIDKAYAQSVDPLCADFMCDRDDWLRAKDELCPLDCPCLDPKNPF